MTDRREAKRDRASDGVLIANRGEIAVRLVRAARGLGLRTVAVFSDADRGAAARPPRRRGSAARARRTERELPEGGRHPRRRTGDRRRHDPSRIRIPLRGRRFRRGGRGRAGLVFVGPTPHQLRVFGTKHTARAAAGPPACPMFPGSGLLDDADDGRRRRRTTIGYPVMLKATGGGGGIGMQVCRDADELRAAFDRVTRLAERSFGSAGVFVERFVDHARHVEVQIFGDGHGRRACRSVIATARCSAATRRCIEEAPAPGAARRDSRATALVVAGAGRVGRTTAPRAPSSSSTTRGGRRRRSSRSMRACRSSTRSPRPSRVSIWRTGCSGWPVASATLSHAI